MLHEWVVMVRELESQLGLFHREPMSLDEPFGRLERIDLGRSAWLDLEPGWLQGDRVSSIISWRPLS